MNGVLKVARETVGTEPGLAGKTVTFFCKYPSSSTSEPLPTVTTGADGTYACQYEELPCWGTPVLYHARFAGDDLYNGSQSPSRT